MFSVLTHPVRGQVFVVEHLESVDDVIENAVFLNEGWRALSSPAGARCNTVWNNFMRVIMDSACTDNGAVVMFKSKNKKPLGYMVLTKMQDEDDTPGLFLYFGFSNGKYEGAPEASMGYVRAWARDKGYKFIQAQTRRINGASMRLFKKKLGFKPKAMIFETTL